MRKSYADIRAILDRIAFMDRWFNLLRKGDGYLLQVCYREADIHTGQPEIQKARKWYVSPWMTETEIVETAFGAVQRSMMHVVGEHFLYRGQRVYSPHFSIAGRVALAVGEHFDARPGNAAERPPHPALLEGKE